MGRLWFDASRLRTNKTEGKITTAAGCCDSQISLCVVGLKLVDVTPLFAQYLPYRKENIFLMIF